MILIKMKKLILILLINVLNLSSYSQYIVNKVNEDFYLREQDGTFVLKKTTFTEEGATTIPINNCKAVLKTTNGKVYNPVNGRIDLLTSQFIYTINGQDLICVLPIQQIIFDSCNGAKLNGAIFRNGYPSISTQDQKSFYQILTEGRGTLLKYYGIQWQDDKPYNTTNVTRVYKTIEQYYLYLNGQMFKLEKNKKNLAGLLAIPADYLSNQKINLKKEEDVIKLIEYYNHL